ncbi:hypothetical protein V5O48_017587 [Marasmius crinis-equi]|uniref:SGNH hydrolase-type esterase domain-containing protein n=1 Tax=Marasmius crinis-equi TaxID=585013 RepID=A0ABR3ENK9_9AGAR
MLLHFLSLLAGAGMALGATVEDSARTLKIRNDNPLIYYHGRWDSSPGTWWAGSGFNINVQNLKFLQLELGPHTTQPFLALGVIFDDGPTNTVNVSQGVNEIAIPLPAEGKRDGLGEGKRTVVKFDVEGWQNNRMNLESVILNGDATLHPYEPSNLAFQFIGDSLSSGQFLPEGINQEWPFLVAERYKAEYRINAQPGAALTVRFIFPSLYLLISNTQGVLGHRVVWQPTRSVIPILQGNRIMLFFIPPAIDEALVLQTEDTGYFNTDDHNFTTPWDFSRDTNPPTTHVVIHIGANDASQNVTADEFVKVYEDFLVRLREINPHQPIFVFTPWGWPNPDGTSSFYYDGQYQKIVDARHAIGDTNVFLVNTTGWVSFDDVFPENVHPNVPGNRKIADEFIAWLKEWGLEP